MMLGTTNIKNLQDIHSPGIEQQGRETEDSFPSSAQVKNEYEAEIWSEDQQNTKQQRWQQRRE